jgi:hypothetical protein
MPCSVIAPPHHGCLATAKLGLRKLRRGFSPRIRTLYRQLLKRVTILCNDIPTIRCQATPATREWMGIKASDVGAGHDSFLLCLGLTVPGGCLLRLRWDAYRGEPLDDYALRGTEVVCPCLAWLTGD